MIRHRTIDYLIRLYILLIAVRNICLFSGLSALAATVFYIVYIVVVLTVAISIVYTVKKPVKADMYLLSSITIMVALVIIPMNFGAYIWLDNGYLHINFLLTMLLIISTRKIVISLRTIETCYIISIIQALFALALSIWPSSFENGRLVLHMGNPNQAAIVLWTIFSLCFLYWSKKKNSRRRSVGLWILMIGLLILIFLTESRTGILSFLIVIFLYYWVKILKRNKEVPIFFQVSLLVSPIIIPTIVIAFSNILPADITFLGKVLFSGREIIWNRIIEEFISHPFLAHLNARPSSGYVLQNGIATLKAMGAHNGILAIQWYYGLIVSVSALYVIWIRIKDIKRCAANNINSCFTYIVILATVFSMSFEEGMIMGNVCTTMILPVLFIIGQSEDFLEDSTT